MYAYYQSGCESTLNEGTTPNQYSETYILPRINFNEDYYENVKKQISGIQFHKRFFPSMTSEEINHFLTSFRGHIYKIAEVLSGNIQAAGNDVKIVNNPDGLRIIKFRNGSNRILTTYNDSTLTLLCNSPHDRQNIDIHKIKRHNIGYIYYPLSDFISLVNLWLGKEKNDKPDFTAMINNPMYYTYDDDQLDIMTQNERVNNISVVGNAGAGKSVIGINWMLEKMALPDQRCLYLTMSGNLVDMLIYQLSEFSNTANNFRESVATTALYMKDMFQECYPDIPEENLLDSVESYQVFCKFLDLKITEKFIFKLLKNKSICSHYKSPEGRLMAWDDIHGIIKGGVPRQMEYNNLSSLPPYLDCNQFKDILRHEWRERNKAWFNFIYKVFELYQDYLREQKLVDDNDMARMILNADNINLRTYDAVFIDECQDLTQVELLALFHLLQNARQKRLASDRCQVVQPTHFSESWMRTTINKYDEVLGKDVVNKHHRPFHLHYNYRSTKSIVDYQNNIIDYFKKQNNIHFKEEEVEHICVPDLAEQGNKPVWIVGNEKNKHMLLRLLHTQIIDGSLQVIVANHQSKSVHDIKELKSLRAYLVDVPGCKGMEYASVLMFNVLKDTDFDTLQALRYYYVSATRAYRNLIIYEEATGTDQASRTSLLKDAYEKGLIDCCKDLNDISPYSGELWKEYLLDTIGKVEDIVRQDEAKTALSAGRYQLAYKLFMRDDDVDKNILSYCQAGMFIDDNDNKAALDILYRIPKEWSYRGISRMTAARNILQRHEVEKDEYIAARILSMETITRDFMDELKDSWKKRYGKNTVNQVYRFVYSALTKYKYANECYSEWLKIIGLNIKDQYSELVTSIDTGLKKEGIN